jgi:hypothetical protein
MYVETMHYNDDLHQFISNSWIVVIAGGRMEVKQKPNLINYLPPFFFTVTI